ncbi:methyltransferase domain-containing protein [Candidatus Binatia bacterium]|nr:methyltransferase domain-containing protein [Candidatus Binatia bacterium]
MERHVDRIRTQFTRQAEIYARMRQTTDQRGLDGLVQLAAALPRDRVLDVACGPGFLTMAFAARAEQVTGFDATEALLDLARAEASRRGLGNVTFASGDAEQLPYADESFDVVACRAAFHHFTRPERVLAEMRRVARRGGRLVIADMLGSDEPGRAALHDRMERLCDPTHVRALPQSELVRLFDSARLDVRHTARGELGITVDEWIAHGGPDDETERELRALAAASVDGDRAGLGMHRDTAGRLAFAHRTAAFLLVRPA